MRIKNIPLNLITSPLTNPPFCQQVTLEHPYFNTANGRKEWVGMKNRGKDPTEFLLRNNFEDGKVHISEENGVVYIHAEINLPNKFYDF